MKNPYIVLGVDQDAEKAEIMKARMQAMKKKAYSLQEIQLAEKQLLDPAKRLAADFLFPTKVKARRLKIIKSKMAIKELDFKAIDEDALNSLK